MVRDWKGEKNEVSDHFPTIRATNIRCRSLIDPSPARILTAAHLVVKRLDKLHDLGWVINLGLQDLGTRGSCNTGSGGENGHESGEREGETGEYGFLPLFTCSERQGGSARGWGESVVVRTGRWRRQYTTPGAHRQHRPHPTPAGRREETGCIPPWNCHVDARRNSHILLLKTCYCSFQ